MTADTQTLPTQLPSRSPGFSSISETDILSAELAKMLKLVAPASMNADQQALWLASAVEALEGIRAAEVSAIALEIRRSVTHHQKIVPEIARLVAARRSYKSNAPPSPYASEMSIAREGTHRRAQAKNQQEIEAAAEWEREERIKAGLHVPPREPAFSAAELAAMSPTFVRMGLKCGALAYRDGRLVNA
jgi:hypothetical protein